MENYLSKEEVRIALVFEAKAVCQSLQGLGIAAENLLLYSITENAREYVVDELQPLLKQAMVIGRSVHTIVSDISREIEKN